MVERPEKNSLLPRAFAFRLGLNTDYRSQSNRYVLCLHRRLPRELHLFGQGNVLLLIALLLLWRTFSGLLCGLLLGLLLFVLASGVLGNRAFENLQHFFIGDFVLSLVFRDVRFLRCGE